MARSLVAQLAARYGHRRTVEERRAFLKATWPGFFGLKVIHRPDEDPRASPIDYLERWHWHNRLFGDQVLFLGAVKTPAGLRLQRFEGGLLDAVKSLVALER